MGAASEAPARDCERYGVYDERARFELPGERTGSLEPLEGDPPTARGAAAPGPERGRADPSPKGAPSITGPGLPPRAGVSCKLERRDEVAKGAPYIGFIELHAENCMIRRPAASQARRIGGASSGLAARPRTLDRRRGAAGRGASGASARPDPARPPGERLAWSRHDGACFADLLPQPCDATLTWVTAHVERTQESSACGCCRRLRRPASGSGSRPSARPSS